MKQDGQRGDEAITRKARRQAEAAKNKRKRKSNRAVPAPVETTMKLGRSLRTGGSYVVRVSRKAIKGFNEFTQGGDLPKRERRKSKSALSRNMTYVIFLLTIFVITSVAMMVFTNSSVTVEKQTVSIVGLPRELEGYTILHISDLHGRSFGTRQTSLLRTVNGLSYNLVLFTGDMVGRGGNPQPFYDLLEGMTAKRKAFFIPGDSDPDPLLAEPRDRVAALDELVLSDWVQGAQARGAALLSATTGVEVGAATLWLSPVNDLSFNIQDALRTFKEQVELETEGTLYGLAEDHDSLPFTDYRYQQLKKLDQSVRKMSTDDLHIALSHYPPSEEYIAVTQQISQTDEDTRYTYLPMADLVLAGHYCGGGWKLPFLGAFYVPNTFLERHGWFPAQEDVEGLKMLGTTQLYTSPGLSVTDKMLSLNFRLFNPPTVTLVTLTSAITEDLLGG